MGDQQPAISNEVLGERVERYFDQNRTEFAAIHHHLDAVMQKFDATLDTVNVVREALHDHVALPHHTGTRDKLLELSKDMLDMEKAIGQLRDYQTIQTARQAERSANLSIADKIWVTAMTSVPTILLIYSLIN